MRMGRYATPALSLLMMAMAVAACAPRNADDAAASATTETGNGTPPTPVPAATAQDQPAYSDPGSGITIAPVDGARITHDFNTGILTAASWKLFAEPDSIGTPLVGLVLDGSDRITTGEMRIGRSDDAASVAACLALPAEATGPVSPDTVDIGGVPFTHFKVGDAAMSHYVSADSYRAIRDGNCYAIDLVVAGTRPEVYDPPRTPPFSQQEAQARLSKALAAVRWR